ncbi:AraC family transcriptional regulator [Kibdelosporangium aridum]|uniref:AraC-type DNA-binding protein n=1 Tax=Kibdelosporangium aridum TaxID=2030 RepID=A0A1W2FU19_KIBAR|nr:AraC family transcriptional regulator [Kibdelosporangium aridum]SMD25274.1 AraC-type DNA-binding protein [Kibdelosporangium aridum]
MGDIDVPYALSIHTDDPFEARVRTQEFLGCAHRMTVLDRDRPFLARVRHRSMNGLGLMSSVYGSAVEIGCSPPIHLVTVNFVHGGQMFVDDGGATTVADPGRGAVFCFHEELTMRWSPGMRQLMLTIDKSMIERHLRTLLDTAPHEPVRFTGEVDLADGGQGIVAAVGTFQRALELCGKQGPPPVLAAEIEHGILTALLLGQPNNYTDRIFGARTLPAPRVVRRVTELIDSAPQTAFTVADLAAFAGVSARSLHAAFRRQLGSTPMSYVRKRRLEHAHDELLSLDPAAGIKVIDVALRHGFTHAGRFAAAYRARFGESPSATLRR